MTRDDYQPRVAQSRIHEAGKHVDAAYHDSEDNDDSI